MTSEQFRKEITKPLEEVREKIKIARTPFEVNALNCQLVEREEVMRETLRLALENLELARQYYKITYEKENHHNPIKCVPGNTQPPR